MKYFKPGNIHTVYEAGFSGFALHRELKLKGIQNRVVHAAGIEVAINNRVKTDKRDAHKLASLLESNRLKGIRVPTEQEENQRQLSRTRQQLVEDRTAVKNQGCFKFVRDNSKALKVRKEQKRYGESGTSLLKGSVVPQAFIP